MPSSHIWRRVIIKNNSIVIIRSSRTSNSSVSSFDLRVIGHEVLELLVVMILWLIGNINGLKLFHIWIRFLLLTSHILWNETIVSQNTSDWNCSHSTVTIAFDSVSVAVLQRTIVVVLSTSTTGRSMTAVCNLSLLVIILLIWCISTSLVNFIILSQYVHLFDLCVLNGSLLPIEIIIYVSVPVRREVLFVVPGKAPAFSLVTFIGNCLCLRNSVDMLIQRTSLELRYETALLLGSYRARLFCCLIGVKNDWIWRSHTFSINRWKRLRRFDAYLLSVKILRRSIPILRRRNVLNKIILISRRIHLLLILNKRIIDKLLFLSRNVDFMSSSIHWWFQIDILVSFVILRVNSSLRLVNCVVVFRSIKVLCSVIHYVLRMNYITFSIDFATIKF